MIYMQEVWVQYAVSQSSWNTTLGATPTTVRNAFICGPKQTIKYVSWSQMNKTVGDFAMWNKDSYKMFLFICEI